MTGYRVTLIGIAQLRPTEEVDPAHAGRLAEAIAADGAVFQPILVERSALAILDGHHRFCAARALGLALLPAILIDYDDPRLTLASWSERNFSKPDVLRAAQTGELLPRKSTRHILAPAPEPVRIAIRDLTIS